MSSAIQPHNERAAAMWGAGGGGYDAISRTIADLIEHCVHRLAPQPGERVLDLASGTGWAARAVAVRGAEVVGVDIGADLIEAAKERARRPTSRSNSRSATPSGFGSRTRASTW